MFARLVLDGEIDPAALDERALDQAGSAARVARTNAKAAVERMATEPDRPGALATEAANGIVASIHRFALAAVAMHATQPASHPPVAQLVPLRDGITTTMTGLADGLSGPAGTARPEPLRTLHAELIHGLREAETVISRRASVPFRLRWPSSSARPTSWWTPSTRWPSCSRHRKRIIGVPPDVSLENRHNCRRPTSGIGTISDSSIEVTYT